VHFPIAVICHRSLRDLYFVYNGRKRENKTIKNTKIVCEERGWHPFRAFIAKASLYR
jgi:hypothetical protein